jgi:hypothetical protein
MGDLAQIFTGALGLDRGPVLVDAGFVELSMPRGVPQLPAGGTALVEMEIMAPDGLSPVARYHVFAPVYAEDLHLVIVTAAKAEPTAKRPRARKGDAK